MEASLRGRVSSQSDAQRGGRGEHGQQRTEFEWKPVLHHLRRRSASGPQTLRVRTVSEREEKRSDA